MSKAFSVFVIMFVVICISLTINAAAIDTDFSDAQITDISSLERLKQLEENNSSIEAYLANRAATYSTSYRTLDVPLYQQENTYYCGPACVQMAIKYVKGTKYSQDTLASSMGTNRSNGTYVYKIRDELNSRIGAGTYEYVMTSEYSFANSLVYSIDKGKPVICHINPSYLPNYPSDATNGHYVLAIGYHVAFSGSSSSSTCVYNDPHYNAEYYGTHNCTIAEMTSAINGRASYYIRGT